MKTGSSHGYTYYVHQPNHDKAVTEKRKRYQNSKSDQSSAFKFAMCVTIVLLDIISML